MFQKFFAVNVQCKRKVRLAYRFLKEFIPVVFVSVQLFQFFLGNAFATGIGFCPDSKVVFALHILHIHLLIGEFASEVVTAFIVAE